jgi:serine protease Do
MKSPFPDVVIGTIEDIVEGIKIPPLVPEGEGDYWLFSLQDPFGLRTAIVPVMEMDDNGNLQGLGTAFAVDPWGSFYTADHVLAHLRDQGNITKTGQATYSIKSQATPNILLLLSPGLVYGHAPLPKETWARMRGYFTRVIPGSDPMKALQGKTDLDPLDLALLTTTLPGAAIHNLPLRRNAPIPAVGDVVVAVGYPQIDTFSGPEELAAIVISEGMKVAYGRVVAHYPNGRDKMNLTPVFEVEANWPSGMSGGPVFNIAGEVVGVVSRSISPEDGSGVGVAWATSLGMLSGMPALSPTIDACNSTRRRCWAVLSKKVWNIAGIFSTQNEAEELQNAKGDEWEIRFGSWEIGTDNFVSNDIDDTY